MSTHPLVDEQEPPADEARLTPLPPTTDPQYRTPDPWADQARPDTEEPW